MTGPLVITDTTVLIGLDRIGRLDVLPALYPDIVAPPAVVAEFGSLPDGWRIVPVADPARAAALALYKLDPGECEAIALAQEHAGSLLLIDERRGRRYAIAAGLRVVGAAGVLIQAKQSGVVENVRPLLDALRANGFHLSDTVYRQALALAGESD